MIVSSSSFLWSMNEVPGISDLWQAGKEIFCCPRYFEERNNFYSGSFSVQDFPLDFYDVEYSKEDIDKAAQRYEMAESIGRAYALHERFKQILRVENRKIGTDRYILSRSKIDTLSQQNFKK